jgi:hypothetical protein
MNDGLKSDRSTNISLSRKQEIKQELQNYFCGEEVKSNSSFGIGIQKSYKCTTAHCGKIFQRENRLKVHQKLHVCII